jgi:hypothetical protein
MEFVDTAPDVQVDEVEYLRLLGFPRGHVLEDRSRELADWARDWYAERGRPWVFARQGRAVLIAPGAVAIDGVVFRSERLAAMFGDAGAESAMLVAVSAGPELEREAQRAWLDERPDEYFFLEMYGSAVVERLTTVTGAKLCAWADPKGLAILPHYSPGYPEWDISEQAALAAILGDAGRPGPLEVLESGMLRPKKSLLAVFGVTPHVDRVERLSTLVPCERCSYGGCQFRRAPYSRSLCPEPARPGRGRTAVTYGLSTRALRRWSDERLEMSPSPDGGLDALFRYDGTTCSNMGRTLTFHYRVRLGPREQGYPILDQSCAPAPDDDGYRFMCEYLRAGQALVDAIAREQPPLVGRPLDEALAWKRPTMGPGCFCEPEARQHKWGLVLETIHYALAQRDGDRA